MASMISSFVPFMERALRLCHPALHQPRWVAHHHHATAGRLLSRGGYHPRPDSWGAPSRHRFVKPTSPVQLQTRVFADYMARKQKTDGKRGQPTKKPLDEFCHGMNKLKNVLREMRTEYFCCKSSSTYEAAKMLMLSDLGILDKVYCSNDNDAERLLDEVMDLMLMVPISSEDPQGLDDGARSSVVEASLRAISHLLQTAPAEIGTILRRKISSEDKVRRIMENIRDTDGWDDKTRNLAREILRTTTLNSQVTNDGELS